MEPRLILQAVNFIRGKSDPTLVVESSSHAEPLANVLYESKVLFDMLHGNYSLDDITEQISKKNEAAKEYQQVTGIQWPF